MTSWHFFHGRCRAKANRKESQANRINLYGGYPMFASTYNSLLVLFSLLVAILASYTALIGIS
ncbi:NO-binding membrane sensor protein with MHYT domain [Paraburkholderia sp. 40]